MQPHDAVRSKPCCVGRGGRSDRDFDSRARETFEETLEKGLEGPRAPHDEKPKRPFSHTSPATPRTSTASRRCSRVPRRKPPSKSPQGSRRPPSGEPDREASGRAPATTLRDRIDRNPIETAPPSSAR